MVCLRPEQSGFGGAGALKQVSGDECGVTGEARLSHRRCLDCVANLCRPACGKGLLLGALGPFLKLRWSNERVVVDVAEQGSVFETNPVTHPRANAVDELDLAFGPLREARNDLSRYDLFASAEGGIEFGCLLCHWKLRGESGCGWEPIGGRSSLRYCKRERWFD